MSSEQLKVAELMFAAAAVIAVAADGVSFTVAAAVAVVIIS